MQGAGTNWRDDGFDGKPELTVLLKPQAELDLDALKDAGSVETKEKKITITEIVFRTFGKVEKTKEGYRLTGRGLRIDLDVSGDVEADIEKALQKGKSKAVVTGAPKQKEMPDPDDEKKKIRYLVVQVTKVAFDE